MAPPDLPGVAAVSTAVHPGYPERPAVFAERLALYPEGCFVLDADGDVQGYALSHPWRLGHPPKLDTLLGALPPDADTYYLHDISMLPHRRGGAFGTAIVTRLARQAERERLPTMSLMAVGASPAFWRRHHFTPTPLQDPAAAPSYGGATFMTRPLTPGP